MIFAYPGLLWALAAVSVPLIIHLFNFQRHKKVLFTNVRFLKKLEEETRSRSRLKEWLVLLFRCLTIVALVMAFAQPSRKDNAADRAAGNRVVGIYIDNSFSMENVNRQGQLIEIARTRAHELVKTFGPATRFHILTNDFEARHQRLYGADEAIRVIDDIRVSPAGRLLSEAVERQREFLRGTTGSKSMVALSDAQRSTFDVEAVTNDSLISLTLLPLAANKVNNVYIDTCWFESPLQQKGFIQKLTARIKNAGNATVEAGSARLFLNNRQLALASYSLRPMGETDVQFTFECREEGFGFGSVKIEDFPVTFDDELFFAFNSRVSISVALINGKEITGGNAVQSLFVGDSLYQLRAMPEQMIDFSVFRGSDLVVLNGLTEISSGLLSELQKFTSQGGAVVIIPAASGNVTGYRDVLTALRLPGFSMFDTTSTRMDDIAPDNSIFSGVFEKRGERINLPVVNRHYVTTNAQRSAHEILLRLQNGDPMLLSANVNNAQIYLFTMPFNDVATNFPRHALFVPVMYQLSFRSLKAPPLFYNTAANVSVPVKQELISGEDPPHITSLKGELDVIPAVSSSAYGAHLRTRGQITAPGFYQVTRRGDSIAPLAFNYPRRESDLSAWTIGEISDILTAKGLKNVKLLENAGETINAKMVLNAEGSSLWKLFIFLAMLFLVAEVLLLRLMK